MQTLARVWHRLDPRRSLRARFALVLGGSGLLLAVGLALLIDSSQRVQLQAQAVQAASRESRLLGAAFGQLIDERLGHLRQLAALPALASGALDADALRLALEQTRQRQTEFAWLARLDADGRVLAATNALFTGTRYEAGRWWGQALAGSTVGRVRTWPALAQRLGEATTTERRFLELATPVVDPEGRTQGAIVALVDWRWLRDRLGQTAQSAAVGGAEPLLLLADPERGAGARPWVVIGPQALLEQALAVDIERPQGDEVVLDRQVWPDGVDRISTHKMLPLTAQGGAGSFSLLLRQDAAELLAPVDRLRRQLLLLTLAAAGLFAAVSWRLAGHTTGPIVQLAQRASRLPPGDAAAFEAPPADRPPDEITLLQSALHTMDATAREHLARQRESAQRYLALFEASPDGVFVVQHARIAMVNPAGLALLGLAEAHGLIGQPLPRFEPEGLLLPADAADAAGPPGAPVRSRVGQLLRPDGQRVPVEVSLARIGEGPQAVQQVVVRDVTERARAAETQARYSVLLEDRVAERTRALQATMEELRQAQQRLQALNDELAASARQAQAASQAKSAFLANMSHEIRTPMNAIVGLSHLVLDQPLSARARDAVQTMLASGQALMALLDDVLDYSKIEAGQLRFEQRPIALHELLQRCVALFEAQAAQRGLQLRLLAAPGLPAQVVGDALRIAQVVNNLLGNAIKFTDRGSVTLQVAPDGPDAPAGVVPLRFEVRDTGIGIDAQVQAQMFQPFTQADGSITRRFGGTGLGLAICRRLVELMDGEIGVVSQPGAGSCFWFRLPLPRLSAAADPSWAPAAPAALPASLAELAGQLAPLHGAEVLVAEDNPVNQLVAHDLIRRLGLLPTLVEDGEQAVAAVRAAPRRWAAVLMDLHMPRLDGLQACEALRRATGADAPPVLAMSASVFEDDRQRCREAGMVGHVAKPVEPQVLADALLRHARRPGPMGTVAAGAAAPAEAPPSAAPAAPARAELASPPSILPVLDRGLALQRLGGDMRMLAHLLRMFSEQEAGTAARLRELLAQQAWADAAQRAHRLRGSALAVGATRLADAAALLEQRLQPRVDGAAADDDAQLHHAWLHLAGALDTTRLLIQATQESLPDTAAG